MIALEERFVLILAINEVIISSEAKLRWVGKGNYLEPHLALFMKLQETYPEYNKQLSYT